jgi:hypothetical protein
MDALVRASDILIVAPVFFAPGNMDLLRVAVETARRGQPVVVLEADSVAQRDLAEGQATQLVQEALEAGALPVTGVGEAVTEVRKVATSLAGRPARPSR